MFALVLLWSYLELSQFLIIWSGNLPEEIPWYPGADAGRLAVRVCRGGGGPLPAAVPDPALARHQAAAARARGCAIGIVVMRFVDVYWLIVPSFPHASGRFHWMDLAALAGLGGLWLGVFLRQLQTRALLPMNDPYFEEALAHGRH